MTRQETAAVLALFRPVWPRMIEGDFDAAVAVWTLALGDLDVEDVKAAAVDVLQSSRFPPVPADVRERADVVARRRRSAERQRQLAADHPDLFPADVPDDQLLPVHLLRDLDPPADPAVARLIGALPAGDGSPGAETRRGGEPRQIAAQTRSPSHSPQD